MTDYGESTREIIRETLILMSLDPNIEEIKQKPRTQNLLRSASDAILSLNDVKYWEELSTARVWGYLIGTFSALDMLKEGIKNDPQIMTVSGEFVSILMMGQVLQLDVLATELTKRGDL